MWMRDGYLSCTCCTYSFIAFVTTESAKELSARVLVYSLCLIPPLVIFDQMPVTSSVSTIERLSCGETSPPEHWLGWTSSSVGRPSGSLRSSCGTSHPHSCSPLNHGTLLTGAIGYSWLDGLLRNPWSGVQTPQVLGYSGLRVAEPLIRGSNP